MKTIRNNVHRAALIERINKLTGDETPSWGKMNVNQMVSHLVQAGELPFEASLPDKSTFVVRTVIKALGLYVFAVPNRRKNRPRRKPQERGPKTQGVVGQKELAIQSINKLGDLAVDHDCKHHPFFGHMTAKEWAVIAYKHIDHHLKQFGV